MQGRSPHSGPPGSAFVSPTTLTAPPGAAFLCRWPGPWGLSARGHVPEPSHCWRKPEWCGWSENQVRPVPSCPHSQAPASPCSPAQTHRDELSQGCLWVGLRENGGQVPGGMCCPGREGCPGPGPRPLSCMWEVVWEAGPGAWALSLLQPRGERLSWWWWKSGSGPLRTSLRC